METLQFILSDIGSLGLVAIALLITYFTGTYFERRHFASLRQRERQTLALPLLTRDDVTTTEEIVETRFVYGHTVIAADYFKVALAGLRMFFGGNIAAFESLIDRARREAILRMKEHAGDAVEITTLRIATSQLGRGRVEAVAYGTALYTHPTGSPQTFEAVKSGASARGCVLMVVLTLAFVIGTISFALWLR